MTEQELQEARRHLRVTGEISRALLDALYRVTAALLRHTSLPASLSPYGSWNESVADDLLADWLTNRLLPGGQLLALLDKAFAPSAFSRLAERSLYQYVLNVRVRSQSQNIWERLNRILDGPEGPFMLRQEAAHRSDRFFTLKGSPSDTLFAGPDRELISAAFAVGQLTPLRYPASSTRLSPLISSSELSRFADAVMSTLGAAVTPLQLMAALGARLDLAAPIQDAGEEALEKASPEVATDEIELRAAAVAVIELMSLREIEVLLGFDEGATGSAIAVRLACSPATVHNDQRRIGGYIDRFATTGDERSRIAYLVIEILHVARRRTQD